MTQETAKRELFCAMMSISIGSMIDMNYDLVDRIYDSFEQQLCGNCKHDGYGCSVQDSILRADPDATFTTFGCNSFESCK